MLSQIHEKRTPMNEHLIIRTLQYDKLPCPGKELGVSRSHSEYQLWYRLFPCVCANSNVNGVSNRRKLACIDLPYSGKELIDVRFE